MMHTATRELRDFIKQNIKGEIDTTFSEDEKQALWLYAVLERDLMDFIDFVGDATDDTLAELYKLLTIKNVDHDASTIELNKSGAEIVRSASPDIVGKYHTFKNTLR